MVLLLTLSHVWLFSDPMGCSLTGPSVCGILQARIQEWVAISSSRGSSWPRDWTWVSCIGLQILYHWATRKVLWWLCYVLTLQTWTSYIIFLAAVKSLSHVRLCNAMDCRTPGVPVLHHLPELAQTHVHWVGDAIQPYHPLPSPSPPAFYLS